MLSQIIYSKTLRRAALALIALAALLFFINNYQKLKADNARLKENARQTLLKDSLKISQQLLTKKELKEFLEVRDKQLLEQLKADAVKLRQVERIIRTETTYRDTVNKIVGLDSILKAIQVKKEVREYFIDSSKCLTVKGYHEFNGDSLKMVITDKQFKDKVNGVIHWERKPWLNIFGLKIRIFGKKQYSGKVYSDCDSTEIEVLEVNNKQR